MQREEIKERLKDALQKSPVRSKVRRISLFGSHLHGTARKGSDIDLLVEFYTPISMFALVHMERDLSEALQTTVDLSTPMSLSKYFRAEVVRELPDCAIQCESPQAT